MFIVIFAFALGVIVTNGVHIWLNSAQIRRNSETIRRQCEADLQRRSGGRF